MLNTPKSKYKGGFEIVTPVPTWICKRPATLYLKFWVVSNVLTNVVTLTVAFFPVGTVYANAGSDVKTVCSPELFGSPDIACAVFFGIIVKVKQNHHLLKYPGLYNPLK